MIVLRFSRILINFSTKDWNRGESYVQVSSSIAIEGFVQQMFSILVSFNYDSTKYGKSSDSFTNSLA
jgi:hypothetical protein